MWEERDARAPDLQRVDTSCICGEFHVYMSNKNCACPKPSKNKIERRVRSNRPREGDWQLPEPRVDLASHEMDHQAGHTVRLWQDGKSGEDWPLIPVTYYRKAA